MKCDKKDLLLYAVTDRQLAERRDTLQSRLRRHWKVELHLYSFSEKHLRS